VVLRLKSHFPAPLLGLAVGVSAVAILAAIFAFQPPSPPPDRCTDAEARSIALQQFPEDRTARVTHVLHYTRAQSVSVHSARFPKGFTVSLDCVDGQWQVETVYYSR
jgi:hypothetical protein